jgi:hypothetical protein
MPERTEMTEDEILRALVNPGERGKLLSKLELSPIAIEMATAPFPQATTRSIDAGRSTQQASPLQLVQNLQPAAAAAPGAPTATNPADEFIKRAMEQASQGAPASNVGAPFAAPQLPPLPEARASTSAGPSLGATQGANPNILASLFANQQPTPANMPLLAALMAQIRGG